MLIQYITYRKCSASIVGGTFKKKLIFKLKIDF